MENVFEISIKFVNFVNGLLSNNIDLYFQLSLPVTLKWIFKEE